MKIRDLFIGACLIFVSILYSFDQLGFSGLIPLLKERFTITDSQIATASTAVSIAHTAALALVWIFGDTFKRRKLFITCLILWISISLLGTFLGTNSFLIFVSLRTLATIPASLFGVLVPVMLADLFEDRALGYALTVFHLCEALSGLSSMTVSAWIVTSGLPWQTSLVALPLLGLAPLFFLLCSMKTLRNVEKVDLNIGKSFRGVFSILSIKSYVILAITLAIAQFHSRAYMFWYPSMYLLIFQNKPKVFLGLPFPALTSINSAVFIVGMAIGFVPIMWLAQSWRHGTGFFTGMGANLRAYPIVVTLGSFMNAVFFLSSILLLDQSYVACVIVTFFTGFAAAADESLKQQLVLMVVPSSHRAAAVAFYRLFASIVAIPAAQLIGMATDLFRGDSTVPLDRFYAFQKAMLCELSLVFFTVFCFAALTFSFPRDFKRAEGEDSEEERTCLLDKHRSVSLIGSSTSSRKSTFKAMINDNENF